MVPKQKTSNGRGDSAMECRYDIDVATARKGSRNSPEHMEEQRDHDISVLASRLEEEFPQWL